MTRTNSMLIRWRVQVRKSRAHKWVNKGLFETREAARDRAAYMRVGYAIRDAAGNTKVHEGVGFGNTRVLRHVGKGD